MRRPKIADFTWLSILALCLGAPNSRAQDLPQVPTDQNDTKPKPAAHSLPAVDTGAQSDENNTAPPLLPDVTPLTGVQNATLGTTEARHSYWVPGVQLSSSIQSSGANSTWFANNFVIGNLSLMKAWARSQFSMNYSGGGYFSTDSQQGNGDYQQMALSQTFQWSKLTLQFLDQLSYLPQSAFGFGGGTDLGIPGVGGSTGPTIPGLGSGSVPNQSIYAALGPRLSNAGVVQATYAVSRRGSITASASYDILHFTDPGNVDNDTFTASFGYNYVLSHADTIGLVYHFGSFQFPGQPQAFGDHTLNVAYGRKLTGRLALMIAGGPEYTQFRIPVGTQSSKLGGNANVNVTYGLEKGAVMAGYFHGLTGGSGVLTGSTVDTVNFGVTHRLTRVWSGQVSMGYSINKAVATSTQANFPNYNDWFIGGGVNRPIGRNMNFGVAYNATIGTTAQAGCTGGSCTSNQNSNYVTVNFQWQSRPLILP
jgi:hypothetical protein